MPIIPKKFTELVRFDWFMKYMFRDKRDFDILEGFLSVLLQEEVVILEILESESNQERKKDKFNRVDIMVKTAKDERIIVEIQNNDEFDYLQRILYGACKTISENMSRGDSYSSVKKVISVSIVYFQTGQGSDYIYHGATIFKGIHSKDELLLTEEQKTIFKKENPSQLMPEYYLIQAFNFNDLVVDKLDEWVYLFKNSKVEDDFTAMGIDKAKEKLAVAKLPKKRRVAYNKYLNSLHSEASWNEMELIKAQREEKRIQQMIDEAIEKLVEDAREPARERIQFLQKVVTNALKKGLSPELIAELNDISVETVLAIQARLEKK